MKCIFVDGNSSEKPQKTSWMRRYIRVHTIDGMGELRTIRYDKLIMEFNFPILEFAISIKI